MKVNCGPAADCADRRPQPGGQADPQQIAGLATVAAAGPKAITRGMSQLAPDAL